MAAKDTTAREHAELLARVAESLCTRTLNQFAAESRLDGESLKDAFERYEIDYAWHVLGSDRMRDETLSLLQAKLKHPATDAQKSCIADVLSVAAADQSSDLLMSFDNDVAEQLAAVLCSQHERKTTAEAEAMGRSAPAPRAQPHSIEGRQSASHETAREVAAVFEQAITGIDQVAATNL